MQYSADSLMMSNCNNVTAIIPVVITVACKLIELLLLFFLLD
jgi:hypothetical protein